ncbi:MAG TPA: hypothetical protein VN763_03895 [Saprospiraceae bacterium]|nr:hypothetical protein [Saprospiraceae bacterium]HZV45682.1 hypothetical protein [Saprospiraceae bacterium]
MKKLIGTLLIVFAIILAIDGVRKFDASEENVRFLGIRIHAEDTGGKQTAFIELGLALVALAGGVSLLNGKKALV